MVRLVPGVSLEGSFYLPVEAFPTLVMVVEGPNWMELLSRDI